MSELNWVKLRKGDDWGVRYYAVEPLDSNGHASAERGIVVNHGEPVSVRWSDGVIEQTTTIVKRHQANVYDMGHEYRVSYDEILVRADVHGLEVHIPIDQVDVPHEWVRQHTPHRATQ